MKFLSKIFLVFTAMASCVVAVNADALSEFYALSAHDPEAAIEILLDELNENPKSPDAGRFNYIIADAYFGLGNYSEARKYYTAAANKGEISAWLPLGELAFMEYDFDTAENCYSKYTSLMKKAKREIGDEVSEAMNRMETAESFLERVEKIVVLDSICVPKDDFFNAYRLPASSGTLMEPFIALMHLPEIDHEEVEAPVYINEKNDYMIWSGVGADGLQTLFSAAKLTDGKYHLTEGEFDTLEIGENSDVAFPYLMPDGITLYFAVDDENSIGGYDIYVATRDPVTGEFLEPQNLGMPYNSPANDYMMVVDEENGIGWFATDRSSPRDMVTVYVYLLNDMRINYDPSEEEDLEAKAMLKDYRSTWEGKTYTSPVNDIVVPSLISKNDKLFEFRVSKDEVYTSYSDFRTEAGEKAMRAYLAAEDELAENLDRLSGMRKDYYEKPSKDLSTKILEQEKRVEVLRKKASDLKNEVYKQIK